VYVQYNRIISLVQYSTMVLFFFGNYGNSTIPSPFFIFSYSDDKRTVGFFFLVDEMPKTLDARKYTWLPQLELHTTVSVILPK
jgi:hypothetical protein